MPLPSTPHRKSTNAKFIGFERGGHLLVGHDAAVQAEIRRASPFGSPVMTETSPSRDLPTTALLPFVLITFAITWGTVGFYIGFPDKAVAWFGEISGSHPFFFLATWGPAIAAFLLVPVYTGWAGLKAFVSRLLVWRCSPMWAGFVLIGLPLVFMAGSLIKGGGLLAPLPAEGAGPMVAHDVHDAVAGTD